MKPLISIIVPVYNVEKYIKKCIDSIKQQTYKNLQIILVDDGSSDGSGKICDEYAAIDKRIEVLHKTNGGTAFARNVGLNVAEGEFISFIDSDDYVDREMIEILYQAINDSNADISACGYSYINEKGGVLEENGNVTFPDEVVTDIKLAYEHFLNDYAEYYVVVWNKLYRKTIWENLFFPEDRICEDAYISHSIISRCKKIIYINKILYYYVQRETSKMYQSSNLQLYRYTKDIIYVEIERIIFFANSSYINFAKSEYERSKMHLAQNFALFKHNHSVFCTYELYVIM